MYLLAVSGGPDSMFLLDQYRHKKIVVATVNYHVHPEANAHEALVRKYCQTHNLPYESLSVKQKPQGNFEAWAREVRYTFFAKIYHLYNCKKLLLAHHKDDFLETALMQQRAGRFPKFFGIKTKNQLYQMQIKRPLINWYWKADIIKELAKSNIPYGIDPTNADPSYTQRNNIRNELKTWSKAKKRSVYSWFKMSNKILRKKNKLVAKYLQKWARSNYTLAFFRSLRRYQLEILYDYLHQNLLDLKLSKAKLEGICTFIEGAKGQVHFKLNKHFALTKAQGKLKITKL